MTHKNLRPLLAGMPEPEAPTYQAHICHTHLDPLADVLGVEGCACKSCKKARRTSEVENFRAQSLVIYEQEFAASRRAEDEA
jgi:hypothetical protein